MTISDPQANEVKALVTQYLVRSGEEIKDANWRPLDFACTPHLPDDPGRSTDWSDQKARGIPLPVAGQILLDCAIRRDGEVVNRPTVIVDDGKLATIETAERDGRHRYRFDITASTSSADCGWIAPANYCRPLGRSRYENVIPSDRSSDSYGAFWGSMGIKLLSESATC